VLHVTRFYASWRGDTTRPMPRRRLLLATAFAGVRGAITLAGVLSVPFALENGEAFPERNLMIFLATAVILISLLVAAAGLPLLLRGMTVDEDPETEESKVARLRACEAAIAAIADAAKRETRGMRDDDEAAPIAAAASRLIDTYEARIRGLREEQNTAQSIAARAAAESELQMIGIQAERAQVMRMHRHDDINDTVMNALLYEIDMRESALRIRSGGRRGHS
jgi:CPA1 family monovalent cation:H+ antiporter